jgi:hypothetical protein
MPTGRDTLLRLMRRTEPPKRKTPRVLGLDDFAWKKGDRYGTLLVDLEARIPVDLLPDREAASVARWLREHPGVKLISRDRAGMYAEGAKRGAPCARQIADRYHLLVNLRDTLKDALARHQDVLPVVDKHGKEAGSSSPTPGEATPQQESRGAEHEAEPLSADTPQLSAAQRRRQISRANLYWLLSTSVREKRPFGLASLASFSLPARAQPSKSRGNDTYVPEKPSVFGQQTIREGMHRLHMSPAKDLFSLELSAGWTSPPADSSHTWSFL